MKEKQVQEATIGSFLCPKIRFFHSRIGSFPDESGTPFATIQKGIDIASNSDTVLVVAGTYTENINYNGKNVVVGSLYLTTSDTTYISSLYLSISNSSFDTLATPSLTAASATALASQIKTLASNGFGIIYSGPN